MLLRLLNLDLRVILGIVWKVIVVIIIRGIGDIIIGKVIGYIIKRFSKGRVGHDFFVDSL